MVMGKVDTDTVDNLVHISQGELRVGEAPSSSFCYPHPNAKTLPLWFLPDPFLWTRRVGGMLTRKA